MKRSAFYISDSTGITAQTLGHSLLNQFEGIEFEQVVIPYVDSVEKARDACRRINKACEHDGAQAVVFDTVVDTEIREILAGSNGFMMDILSTFLKPLEQYLNASSSYTVGRSPATVWNESYKGRINAVHYAMDNDDGSKVDQFDKADLILIGVSRSGKTPTSIYLALQFGIYTANYPLTEEDLGELRLPKCLQAHKNKLFGLTISAERLSSIRSERRADSRYASLKQCEYEVKEVEALFRRFGIPFINTTRFSVEEISTRILSLAEIDRR